MPSEANFKEGAVIYFENDPSEGLYLIRSGRVELQREISGGGSRTYGPGEILGLADALGGKIRIGTARALSPVSATVLTPEEFCGMIMQNIPIGLKVITSLCAELREIDELISRRMRRGVDSGIGDPEALRKLAEHFRKKDMPRAARYAYGRYLETGPPAPQRLEATLELGALCEKDGELEVALQIYHSILEQYPEEQRAAAAYERLRGLVESFEQKL